MSDDVHVLTPSLDHERLSQPLNRDEPPADRVHLVKPPDTASFPAQASDMLAESLEQFDIPVNPKVVEPTPYPNAVHELYDLIRTEVAQGHDVFINVSGGYHQLSSAVATAASHVVSDTIFGADATDTAAINNVRSKVHFYSTEPEKHYFDNLVSAYDEIEAALQPERVETLQENANELADRVQRDRDTVRGLNMLLAADLDAAADRFGLSDDSDLADSLDSLQKLVEGINMTVEAMSDLQQNKYSIEFTVGVFVFSKPVQGVFDLMSDIKEDDEPIESTDLFNYFENRLDTINQIVSDAQALESSPPDSLAEFAEIETKGVARGVREFDNITSPEPPAPYIDQPGPLESDLRATEQALLYTLWDVDSANSVQEFTHQVFRRAVSNAPATAVDLSDTSNGQAFWGTSEPIENSSELADSIKSTVQYNLQQLDEKGYVKRVKGEGRKKAIEFTRAGEIYVATREFDESWLGHAFKDLVESIQTTRGT
jgi:hypothetical protein